MLTNILHSCVLELSVNLSLPSPGMSIILTTLNVNLTSSLPLPVVTQITVLRFHAGPHP